MDTLARLEKYKLSCLDDDGYVLHGDAEVLVFDAADEIKRLREALQGVLTADSCFKGTMVSRIYAMRDIAKSALEETK